MIDIERLAREAGMHCGPRGMGLHAQSNLERFAALVRNEVLEDAANGSSALAKKWWARHCETNKHMETTREAHEDFCQLERAIRAMKKEQPNG